MKFFILMFQCHIGFHINSMKIPDWTKLAILVFLLLALVSNKSVYKLVLHSKQRGAMCLDGSPAGLYINEGTGVNKTKYMLFFMGGGFCGNGTLAQTIDACYNRSKTFLGTTSIYPKEHDFGDAGVMSTKASVNPVFHDWTKVWIPYCDGVVHQGYRESGIPYKNTTLYFRGSRNSLQQFHYLDEAYDFYNGEMIVITGLSAGGMGTYEWMNYLVDHTKKAKVIAIPDSGFFITDFYSPLAKEKVMRNEIMNLLKLVETTEQLPDPVQKCMKKPDMDIVNCSNAANYVQFFKAPFMAVESVYDAWSMKNIVRTTCLTNLNPPFSLKHCNEDERNAIEGYRTGTMDSLKQMKEKSAVPMGVWAPACVQHGYASYPDSMTSSKFKIDGVQLWQAINEFVKNPENPPWHFDTETWPDNKGCNGLIFQNIQTE